MIKACRIKGFSKYRRLLAKEQVNFVSANDEYKPKHMFFKMESKQPTDLKLTSEALNRQDYYDNLLDKEFKTKITVRIIVVCLILVSVLVFGLFAFVF